MEHTINIEQKIFHELLSHPASPSLTVSPSMQTVKGMMRMYQPAQKPAMGKPMKMRSRNLDGNLIAFLWPKKWPQYRPKNRPEV